MALRSMFRVATWGLLMFAGVAMIAVGLGPRSGAYQTLTVLTGSMRPAIPPGSLVVVRPVEASSVSVGDIVTINAPIEGSPVVTHRIFEIVETGPAPVIRTKGDANAHPDPWLARVEGGRVWTVSMVVPHAGTVMSGLRSAAAKPVLLYALPAFLALWLLADIWRGDRSPGPCPVKPRRGGMPRVAAMLARGSHAHP